MTREHARRLARFEARHSLEDADPFVVVCPGHRTATILTLSQTETREAAAVRSELVAQGYTIDTNYPTGAAA